MKASAWKQNYRFLNLIFLASIQVDQFMKLKILTHTCAGTELGSIEGAILIIFLYDQVQFLLASQIFAFFFITRTFLSNLSHLLVFLASGTIHSQKCFKNF